MAGGFWRLMSTQHWSDDLRRMPIAPIAQGRREAIRPFAEGQTLVEPLALEASDTYLSAWRDLTLRALEPNPFLDPDFALPAALHMPVGQRPEFIGVWQGAGFEPRARLIGLWPFEHRRPGVLRAIGQVWKHRHGALGAPLVDGLAGGRSLDALAAWLRENRRHYSAIAIPTLVADGPLHRLISERCATNRWPSSALNRYERAVLLPGQDGDSFWLRARSTKHRREIDRLRRRLEGVGTVAFHSASSPQDVRLATEWFLAIERRGWKGQRGTAFLSDISDATFARTTLRLLAAAGKCRIDWLALDDRPIAMAIVLANAGRAYFWKTAYDEEYAYFSPGVQLARELADRQLADPTCDLTDSCAIADHPMIDRVWPDRQTIVDMMFSVEPNGAYGFSRLAGRERFRRDMRALVKKVAYTALRRRAS